MTLLIRSARSSDYSAFATLFPLLKVDDPTPSLELFSRELAPQTVVAEVEGQVVGYCYAQLLVPETVVRHLVVAPPLHGQRVGQRLLTEVANRARAAGATRWALNVKPDNDPALRLYRRLGLRERFTSRSLRFSWAWVEQLPGDARARPLLPSEDAQASLDTGIAAGLLSHLRTQPDRFFSATHDASGRFTTVAAFNPAFPGAYPFRATDVATAKAVLLAVQPFARHHFVQVVVEGQLELSEALVRDGATVRLEIVNLSGPLPTSSVT